MQVSRTLIAAGLVLGLSTACGGEGGQATLNTFADSASYAIGMSMGQSVLEIRDQVNLDLMQQGLLDVADGRLASMSENEAMAVLQVFAAQVRQSQQQQMVGQAETNRTAGEAYLAENGAREGVTTTASGLQYEVLEQGSGPQPSVTDRVRVHYRGSLVDGSVFESSFEGDPAVFGVDEVIPGWTEALQLMNVGSRFRLVIPSDLAYGQGGGPGGPNSTLVFEVQLLDIVQ